MNIISAIVGLTIAGAAAPSIVQMSLAPLEAQKRAQMFTQAEALAVTFAGKAEAEQSLPDIPSGCSVTDPIDSVYRINCNAGDGRFQSMASRSFRIAPEINDGGSGGRSFLFEPPTKYSGHQCPQNDRWGVYGTNTRTSACKPQDLWTKEKYLASDPSSWLYDANNHNGWGNHPNY